MSIYRSFGSFVIALLLGALTFFIATPRKSSKFKNRAAKAKLDSNIGDKENLFI